MANHNQFTNLTFSDFEQFVDEWISRTPDMANLFDNQADESTRLFKQIESNNEKLSIIHSHMQIIKYYTDLLERSIQVNNELMQHLEKRVLEVEDMTRPLYDPKNTTIDLVRQKIYGRALAINEILNDAIDELYDLTVVIMKSDEKNIKDPAELITRVLIHQLHNLERIEEKIQKAADQSQIIDCKYGCQLKFTPKPSNEIQTKPYINIF